MTGVVRPPAGNDTRRKRFWIRAGVVAGPEGFGVMLDGKPVLLPGRKALCVASKPLAEALAAEWQAAGSDDPEKRFGPDALPLTRIAGTMIERVEPDRAHSVATLAGYGAHDLLCYRAEDAEPVAALQNEAWQPWLDWLEKRHGIHLCVTTGIMPAVQSPEALAALAELLGGQPDAVLAGLGVAVPALGSLVLGLAVAEGVLKTRDAVRAASVDEREQMRRWGEDAAVLDRIAVMAADVADAERFMTLAAEGAL
ncbi:ATP12 family protein [Acetobacter fallax]|uniref:ATP synthase F1 mitochondrial assembly chaperone ATP12 n=1 Tax=Acetobacter fallax TaxID=1737473 RepID=A0ABX0KAZ7_9PROT|nr:hypothetical protein [Acetobacter fallax]NHO37160.1 hypothetical protein [Acetobacter fallax]